MGKTLCGNHTLRVYYLLQYINYSLNTCDVTYYVNTTRALGYVMMSFLHLYAT